VLDVKSHFETITPSVPVAAKTVKTYRRELRAVVRGLWSDVIDFDQAFESMLSTIERQFTQAWRRGAAECDIGPDELSPDEIAALQERITEETQHISGYLEAIEANSRANGGKLQPLFNRAELWVNRWVEVFELAKSMACADRKGVWRIGPTEKHCRSCAGFDGRVYRFSVWNRNGALPRSSRLECNGFRCECQIDETDAPITRGRFPARLLS